jgi:hypothetical protein
MMDIKLWAGHSKFSHKRNSCNDVTEVGVGLQLTIEAIRNIGTGVTVRTECTNDLITITIKDSTTLTVTAAGPHSKIDNGSIRTRVEINGAVSLADRATVRTLPVLIPTKNVRIDFIYNFYN